MERTLTPDEKIRRAEEIYYRRKMEDRNKTSARVNVAETNPNSGMLKKMILQIVICILIYTIFYMIQNTSYIFSEDVINKTKEILSYDINIPNLYNNAKEYLNFVRIEKIDNNEEENSEETNNEENLDAENLQEVQENVEIENIGGESVEINEEIPVELSQMEQDAKNILETKSLIIPLKGTITSRYGLRNPSTPTVPKNHTGIDIAVNEGTVFIASMAGVVEEVSSKGDLGNHVKITDGDVMTVYAHCKTIYVKQGDKINQGQQIGEVGTTGNTTGPHLHFEIRKENRYVDPDLILEFE